jgi:hypothetical protein
MRVIISIPVTPNLQQPICTRWRADGKPLGGAKGRMIQAFNNSHGTKKRACGRRAAGFGKFEAARAMAGSYGAWGWESAHDWRH